MKLDTNKWFGRKVSKFAEKKIHEMAEKAEGDCALAIDHLEFNMKANGKISLQTEIRCETDLKTIMKILEGVSS